MNLRSKLLVAAAGGLSLCAASAGVGLAQSYHNDTSPPTVPYPGKAEPGQMTPPRVVQNKPAAPPSDIVGAKVVDFKGKPIGYVTRVSGDQVVVRYDSYLGMEHANAVFPWRQLNPTYGSGRLLATNLTKGQMEGLAAATPSPGGVAERDRANGYDRNAETSSPSAYDNTESASNAASPGYSRATALPPTSETPGWLADSKPDHPTSAIVGDPVVDYKGKPIGHVTSVHGDQVVVKFDKYLFQESRISVRVFPWQQLTPAYGNVGLLTTKLTKGQMESLPKSPI